MTAAETELVAAPNVVRLVPKRTASTRRRLGTAAASLVIVGGTAGMAAAASGALPGDPLYPVKRGVEQTGAAVRMSDAAEGEALLRQANTRLDEVRSLQAQGSRRSRAARVHRGLLPQCRRPRLEEAVHGLPGRGQRPGHHHGARLHLHADGRRRRARRGAPPTPRLDELLLDAADTLADIDQQARVLCGSCGPEAALAPPDALSSGAGAATVDNLLARPVAQAQVDVAAVEAARNAALKAGASAAEATASTIPQIDDPTGAAGGSTPALADGPPPVNSTITAGRRPGPLAPERRAARSPTSSRG